MASGTQDSRGFALGVNKEIITILFIFESGTVYD